MTDRCTATRLPQPFIASGEKAIIEKRVLSHKEAKLRMARWLA